MKQHQRDLDTGAWNTFINLSAPSMRSDGAEAGVSTHLEPGRHGRQRELGELRGEHLGLRL